MQGSGNGKKTKVLGIWLNAEFVDVWWRNRGEETFQYDNSWLTSKHSRALSLSLPFTLGNQKFSGEVVKLVVAKSVKLIVV